MFPRAELGSSMQLIRIDLNVIVHKQGLVRISMSQSHRRRTPACLPGRPPAPVKTSQEKVSAAPGRKFCESSPAPSDKFLDPLLHTPRLNSRWLLQSQENNAKIITRKFHNENHSDSILNRDQTNVVNLGSSFCYSNNSINIGQRRQCLQPLSAENKHFKWDYFILLFCSKMHMTVPVEFMCASRLILLPWIWVCAL